MNVWAVLDTSKQQVVAVATHYQEAARVEDSLTSEWMASFVGPFAPNIEIPFTLCRVSALSKYYPGYKLQEATQELNV